MPESKSTMTGSTGSNFIQLWDSTTDWVLLASLSGLEGSWHEAGTCGSLLKAIQYF